MWREFYLAFVVAAIGGTILSIIEVDAQSTVDDSASCESSTLDEAVNLIKQGMNNVGLIKENLEDVKNLLGSNQQQNNATSVHTRKDLEDLKAAFDASTQQQRNASFSFNEALTIIREDLEDVKSVLASNQQQNNATCISKKDFEDLKAAFASNQQQSPQAELSSSKQALVSSLLSNCIPLLIQQHVNSSSNAPFNRSWAEYKVGFNDTKGNYWLGNDLLSQLTVNDHYKLRFELQLRNHSWYWAEYSSFIVLSETYNYRLLVSGYSGNIGDALSYHNNMMFSTYDRDNDQCRSNCALSHGGGFWYKCCDHCKVNGVRSGFKWYQPGIKFHDLQTSRMWLTC